MPPIGSFNIINSQSFSESHRSRAEQQQKRPTFLSISRYLDSYHDRANVSALHHFLDPVNVAAGDFPRRFGRP